MRRGVLTGFTGLTGFWVGRLNPVNPVNPVWNSLRKANRPFRPRAVLSSIRPWCVASCMLRQSPTWPSRLWDSCLQGQRYAEMEWLQVSSWLRCFERNDLRCERSSGPGGGNGPCFFERYSKRIASSSSSVKGLPGHLRMPMNLAMSRTFLALLPFASVSVDGLIICAVGIVAQKGSAEIEKTKEAA